MKKKIFAALLVAVALTAWVESRRLPAQGGPGKRPAAIPDSALSPKALKAVGLAYQRDIAPIMEKACFDCHSSKTVYPWYHHLPGVAQYLDGHIAEARERLDLSDGFPFKGRAPIVGRVRGIGRWVERDGMPPWDYKLMHARSRLSDPEKKIVIDWSSQGFEELSRTAKAYVAPPPR
jgi:hypothetical protein